MILGSDADALKLAQELDGLPLALATAGAYLYQVSTSFADYLQLYKESWLRLQQKTPQLLSYEDRALYSTWGISFNHVKQQSELAANLLQLWAYFDNQDVWFELLHECQKVGPEWFSELMQDRLSFDGAVRVLCDHGLVDADTSFRGDSIESPGYSMHSCVHSWTTHVINERWDVTMATLALTCVGRHVPRSSKQRYWVLEQRLMGHINHCSEYITSGLLDQDDKLVLSAMHSIGRFYMHRDKGDEAEDMYRRALGGTESVLGGDHMSTFHILINLATLYETQGKLDESEEMYRRGLEGYETALGLDHKSTLDTLNNLGILYRKQGKLEEAEEMYRRALEGYEKAFGRDHMSTFDTVNNLGVLYWKQGKLEEAEVMYWRALEGYEKSVGPDHLSTLDIVNNLGILFDDQGKLEKSEAMYLRALEGYEKALGRDHTATLDVFNNLGILYWKQGKLGKAEAMYRQALEGYEASLGPDHKSTLRTVNILSSIYKEQGKPDEAVAVYRRTPKDTSSS